MAWGALVKSVAKGAAKKAATGAIKKKVKGKGKKMAEKMMDAKKEKDNSSAIVVREKSTTLAPMLGGGDTPDTSIKKPSTSKSPLDRIDSALLNIMNTLKSRRKLMLNKSRRNRVQADKEKKGKREGLLESMKNTGKKMVKNVASAASNWWEKLQTFLLMTLLGSLVVAIKENWETIKAQIDKVVKFVQDLWKFLSPVLVPLFKGLSWVVKQWMEMGSELMGLSKDKPKVEKETDKLSKDLKELEKKKDWVTGKFEEAEKGVNDIRGKSFGEVADEAGLGSEVSPDNEEQPKVTKEQVEAEVGEQITGSDIETKLDEFKSKVEEVNSTPIEVDTSKMKKYETGASPVPETGPAIVHKGEVIIPAPVVQKAGGSMNIENIINMMQSSSANNILNMMQSSSTNMMQSSSANNITNNNQTSNKEFNVENILNMMQTSVKNIQKNPLKVISAMEKMSKEFAPMGEQLPEMINKTIKESKLGTISNKITKEKIEKMESILNVLKEQTEYEDPSSNTIIIPLPAPSQPPMGGGEGGETTTLIPIRESGKAALNRYINAVTHKALY
jgi:hypothetical protein